LKNHLLCFLRFAYFILFLFFIAHTPASAQSPIIRAITSQSDLTTTKLTLDKLVDPSVNESAVRRELDQLAAQARVIAGTNATDEQKINAVRRVIYKAGPWNDNRPFTYDHNDPLGLNVQNKLLSTYLRTRRGNCVSMPTLFLILADRLGLNVSFGTAPLHVFIRYTDPKGRAFNIETTSGANLARPEWYRQNMPMTDKAIQSGLYMRTLTRRETVAHMASTVMEARLNRGKFQDAIDIGTAILKQFPRDGYTLVKRGHAYGELLRIECIERFPSRNAMPLEIRTRCDSLAKLNDGDFGKAEAMGWAPSQ
jgi:regulator of sirC expression with transglutaminase-like and TPR domain